MQNKEPVGDETLKNVAKKDKKEQVNDEIARFLDGELEEGESVVKYYLPSKKKVYFSNLFKPFLLCVGLLIAIYCLYVFEVESFKKEDFLTCIFVVLGMFLIIEILFFIVAYKYLKNAYYIVTNKRLLLALGLFSKNLKSVLLSDVKEVVKKNGNLYFITRANDICDVVFSKINNINCVLEEILGEIKEKIMINIINKVEGKKIDLVLDQFVEGNEEKGYVPALMYHIVLKETNQIIGHCSAKIGYNEWMYYAGHTGFSVKEEFRGNGYATEAVGLLKKVFKMNGMNWVYITNNPDNQGSIRVCEKVGAKFIKRIEFSEQDLKKFAVNDSFKNIWELKF